MGWAAKTCRRAQHDSHHRRDGLESLFSRNDDADQCTILTRQVFPYKSLAGHRFNLFLAKIHIPPIPIPKSMQRDYHQTNPLTARIKKIVGQVQGVGRMIEDNRECPEILHTISSIHSALRGLEATLLEDHVRHCVTDAATKPALLEQRLEEIIALYKRRLA